jgi:Xaa-Pro aminopeptidase
MPFTIAHDSKVFAERSEQLASLVQEYANKKGLGAGVVLLIADFEGHAVFRQERSFYYLTGVEEPAAIYMLDLASGKKTLYIPNFGGVREKWLAGCIKPSDAQKYAVDAIEFAGDACKGYQCHPFYNIQEFSAVLAQLQQYVGQGRPVFTLCPTNASDYVTQRFVLQRMGAAVTGLQEHLVDISHIVAKMRRKKSTRELELMYNAIEITMDAHDAVARALEPKKIEYEIQATLEYMFTFSGGLRAFPSIVASGKNSTVLHYMQNDKVIEAGDVVVVDIGAEYNYYCADITRTYPASGTFSRRQREIYNIVLDTQAYIADLARPGMWLSNAEHADKSLNHLAKKFLKEQGYDKYFPHGIGHYLGLDVHDVGDYATPLEAGDVITIEPGIYIPEESIGVRIEDDYWIVEDEAVCMSEALPKDADTIERMVQQKMDEVG